MKIELPQLTQLRTPLKVGPCSCVRKDWIWGRLSSPALRWTSPFTSPGSWFYQPHFAGTELISGRGGMASLRLHHHQGAMAGLEFWGPGLGLHPSAPPGLPGGSRLWRQLPRFKPWLFGCLILGGLSKLSVLICASGQNHVFLGSWRISKNPWLLFFPPFFPLLGDELLSYDWSSLGSLTPGHSHRGLSFPPPCRTQQMCSEFMGQSKRQLGQVSRGHVMNARGRLTAA